MKKNISINISGIIFHIEEDGYELLKNYLEEINRYFSNYEDSQEIIEDIEGRIAEIFLSKTSDEKQVITLHDVDALVATMGNVKDFQVLEDGEEQGGSDNNYERSSSYSKSKTLHRDKNRKILGGVASGVALYFKIDPVWVRLILILLVLGSYGALVVAYLIAWAILPEDKSPGDDTRKTKKMYRDPEKKVLGGVAGGVAAYFGADATAIRILFILSVFLGGTGALAYIVLWIILPEANSISEKVQMKGEPVTLSSIESNIKKELKVENEKEESALVKVLLFPFRMIAAILKGLGRILEPLLKLIVEAARIIFGFVLAINGVAMLVSILICAGVYFGLVAMSDFNAYDVNFNFPMDLFTDSIPTLGVLFATAATLIPALVLILIGISVLAKRWVIKSTIGWSMFGIWLFSVIGLAIFIPSTIYKFKEEGRYVQTNFYSINNTPVIAIEEVGLDDYDVTTLRLRGWDGEELKLVKEFEARGSSRKEAVDNAKSILYNVTQEDSVLTFDSNISFEKGAKFRGQDLDMDLYIPFNKPFTFKGDVQKLLTHSTFRYNRYRYNYYELEQYLWVITPAGLECITCEKEHSNYDDYESYGAQSIKFKLDSFSNVNIGNAFTVDIKQGENYKILVTGNEEDIDEVIVERTGDYLDIKFKNDRYDINRRSRRKLKVKITMPDINMLTVKGASKTYLQGFKEDKIRLDLSGASYVDLNSDFGIVDALLTGNSELEMKGTGEEIKARLKGNSKLSAYYFRAQYGAIDADGLSEASTYITDELLIDASFISKIRNRGGAEVLTEGDTTPEQQQ